MMTSRSSLIGVLVVCGVCLSGCQSSPTAPESSVHVSGRLLVYFPGVVSPLSAILVGWVEANGAGRTTGPVSVDGNARYDLVVERGARVRLYAGGNGGNEIYQPCAVTVVADADVERDVRVVGDYSLIGAMVPSAFLERTRTLSGVVYETMPGGSRRPLPFATVSVGGLRDGNYDLGWPVANTRTDSDGRYLICGLEGDMSVHVYATHPQRPVYESVVDLNGNTVLDIELNGQLPTTTARR